MAFLLYRISSQLANSQSVFAKLLQFESESHRLAQIMEQTQLLKRTKRVSLFDMNLFYEF